jgi:hypothetical protein
MSKIAQPTWQHAEEVYLQFAAGMILKDIVKLLQRGQLPGKLFGIQVKMTVKYMRSYIKITNGIKNNTAKFAAKFARKPIFNNKIKVHFKDKKHNHKRIGVIGKAFPDEPCQ